MSLKYLGDQFQVTVHVEKVCSFPVLVQVQWLNTYMWPESFFFYVSTRRIYCCPNRNYKLKKFSFNFFLGNMPYPGERSSRCHCGRSFLRNKISCKNEHLRSPHILVWEGSRAQHSGKALSPFPTDWIHGLGSRQGALLAASVLSWTILGWEWSSCYLPRLGSLGSRHSVAPLLCFYSWEKSRGTAAPGPLPVPLDWGCQSGEWTVIALLFPRHSADQDHPGFRKTQRPGRGPAASQMPELLPLLERFITVHISQKFPALKMNTSDASDHLHPRILFCF